MAVNHVILKEYHADRRVPYFHDYVKKYTDGPFLVRLEKEGGHYRPGRLLRANTLDKYKDEENGDWKFLMFDAQTDTPKMPKGSVGHRWQSQKGQWNLELKDGLDGSPIDPELSFLEQHDEVFQVGFYEFVSQKTSLRGVPVRYVETDEGRVPVTTAFDLLVAQFGVSRGLAGDYPESYDEADMPYTPAWQEQFTGIGQETVTRLAREFANNAEATNGRSMIIIGASINHWYNNNLAYRAPITSLILCGCPGRNGGGMNHYVGQEKLTLVAPWSSMAFALDWIKPPRRQQSPIWHYAHSDQWRYEGDFTDYAPVPPETRWAKGHALDLEAMAVRLGWMPFYPQFDKNPLEMVQEAVAAGAQTDAEIVQYAVKQLQERQTNFTVDDPDAEESWPRVWFIWRGNAIQSSAKGHEFFLRHYLGTHDNIVAEEHARDKVKTITFREPAPRGKMDLVVDINFRMDSSALYSDIILPTAFWYEKNDLNTTDLHSFVHPLGQAVPPVWESKTDWEIFKAFAQKVSELAPTIFPEPVKDLVAVPLAHDTPDEMSQTEPRDWRAGECDPIPGKTMPHLKIVERDYVNLYNRFISFGRQAREDGVSGNGVKIPIKSFYDELLQNPVGGSPDPRHMRCVEWDGQKYPSLEDALDAANLLLYLAPETNGEVSYTAFKHEEEQVGLPLADLAEGVRNVRMNFLDITRQVRRTLISPCWTGGGE